MYAVVLLCVVVAAVQPRQCQYLLVHLPATTLCMTAQSPKALMWSATFVTCSAQLVATMYSS